MAYLTNFLLPPIVSRTEKSQHQSSLRESSLHAKENLTQNYPPLSNFSLTRHLELLMLTVRLIKKREYIAMTNWKIRIFENLKSLKWTWNNEIRVVKNTSALPWIAFLLGFPTVLQIWQGKPQNFSFLKLEYPHMSLSFF